MDIADERERADVMAVMIHLYIATVGTLQREYTYISLPILYIFRILRVQKAETKEKQDVLKKEIDNYIILQLIVTLMLLFYFG